MGAITYDNGDNQARNQGQQVFHSFNSKWTVLTASAEISLAPRSPERGAARQSPSRRRVTFLMRVLLETTAAADSVFVLFAYFLDLPFLPRHFLIFP